MSTPDHDMNPKTPSTSEALKLDSSDPLYLDEGLLDTAEASDSSTHATLSDNTSGDEDVPSLPDSSNPPNLLHPDQI